MTSNRTLLTETEYAAEARAHVEWLNWIFGITSFFLALTALQFASPWKIALIGLPLFASMYIHAFRSFPPSLVALRHLAKQNPQDASLREMQDRLERRFHGWRAVIRLAPFWIGLASYAVVLFSGTDITAATDTALAWIKS